MTYRSVKILNTSLTPYSLPLNAEWRSHYHSTDKRHGYLIKLEDELGNIGYGDCAPLPSHGTETVEEALVTLRSQLSNIANLDTQAALQDLPDTNPNPAARCALDTALLDLISKQQTTPLHRWLNPKSASEIEVNASVGAIEKRLSDRITAALEQGYSVLKIKLGVSEPRLELEALHRICSDLPSSAQLRLDANRAWDYPTAKSFLREISRMPIESLEEPLAQPDINTLKRLQDESHITLALDETVAELNPDTLIQLQPLHRIILKPMALGGVLPALKMGQQAQSLGIDTVVTTTVDSAPGVWAATQLAAALDSAGRLCHGLATSGWLEQDIGAGPDIWNGKITSPQTPGLGFIPYL